MQKSAGYYLRNGSFYSSPAIVRPRVPCQNTRIRIQRRLRYVRSPSQQLRWASTASGSPPKTALFFPGISNESCNHVLQEHFSNDLLGQGVQRIGMATPWIDAFPRTCKPFLEHLDETLGVDLSSIIASGPHSAITATENAQPAIFAVSIMILRVLEQEFGFKTGERINVCLGHSLGEFAALVTSKHLDYNDALRMLRRRAEVVSKCSKEAVKEEGSEYGMVALVCEPDRLSSLIEAIHDFLGHGASEGGRDDSTYDPPAIEQVRIANINAKNQIVLSGSIERISALLVQLRQFGGHDPRAVRLATDSPFHSPIMAPAAETVRDILEKTIIDFPGRFPCVSNVSARPFTSANQIRELLSRQCVDTVRWWDSVRWLDQEEAVRRWVGIGPGKVGRNLVGKEVGMRGADMVRGGGVWGISAPKEIEAVLHDLVSTYPITSNVHADDEISLRKLLRALVEVTSDG